MCEIYLIRHGETLWNQQGCLQGHLDSPLTNNGQQQALRLLAYFQEISLTALYSSDLGRAQKSIAPLAEQQQRPVLLNKSLREISYDYLDGVAKNKLTAQQKEQLTLLFSGKKDICIGKGESLEQLQQRVSDCLNSIAKQHQGKHVAIMSHGLAIVMFLKEVLNIPVDAPRTFNIHNASITHLSFRQGEWMLQSLHRK